MSEIQRVTPKSILVLLGGGPAGDPPDLHVELPDGQHLRLALTKEQWKTIGHNVDMDRRVEAMLHAGPCFRASCGHQHAGGNCTACGCTQFIGWSP